MNEFDIKKRITSGANSVRKKALNKSSKSGASVTNALRNSEKKMATQSAVASAKKKIGASNEADKSMIKRSRSAIKDALSSANKNRTTSKPSASMKKRIGSGNEANKSMIKRKKRDLF